MLQIFIDTWRVSGYYSSLKLIGVKKENAKKFTFNPTIRKELLTLTRKLHLQELDAVVFYAAESMYKISENKYSIPSGMDSRLYLSVCFHSVSTYIKYGKNADVLRLVAMVVDTEVLQKDFYMLLPNLIPEAGLDTTKVDEASKQIIDLVCKVVTTQVDLMDKTKKGRMREYKCVGYIAGFADAAMQCEGISTEAESIAIITLIFLQIFGDDLGTHLMSRFLSFSGNNEEVDSGMRIGGREYMMWLKNKDVNPRGLLLLVNS